MSNLVDRSLSFSFSFFSFLALASLPRVFNSAPAPLLGAAYFSLSVLLSRDVGLGCC